MYVFLISIAECKHKAGTMIDIVGEVDMNKEFILLFIFNRNIYKIVSYKCETIIFYLYHYIFEYCTH